MVTDHEVIVAALAIGDMDTHAPGPEYWVPLNQVQNVLRGKETAEKLKQSARTIGQIAGMYYQQEQARGMANQMGAGGQR